METRIWEIWFTTYEGDECWANALCPEWWDANDVEDRFRDGLNGGVGGDPADIISSEWTSSDDWDYDFTD